MDSSIVSFNHDSTFQTTLKGDCNVVSVHELALHAMRDRCLLLQRRINALENENMRLKLDNTKSSECSPYVPLKEDDKLKLLHKIAELTKQKSQLMHHVFMVSCENKTLWHKIATAKVSDKSILLENTKQPLLRTNTYVHSTPKSSTQYQEKYSESSLEEISLKLINSYIQEKSQLVEQYEQMSQLQNEDEILNVESIGFTYIEDPPTDSLKDIQYHYEKLQDLKRELAKQEKDLKLILSRLEMLFQDGYKCPTCVTNNGKLTKSEHKEIETSDSLINWATPVESSNYHDNLNEVNTSVYKKTVQQNDDHESEPTDRICPMCAKVYKRDFTFLEFQSHVESHFTGNTEMDSIDNIQNIPNSLDN